MRYPNFEIMRLFLAGQVAFAHAWFWVDPNFGWDGLVMAVPSFLAISGFLVLKSYEETRSWRAFMRKRLLRIGPALLLSFILCLVLLDSLTAWNSILNWLTGGLYTLPYRANGPLWSLAWEELAYLVLAVLWGLGAYRRPVCIWMLLAASLGLCWLLRDWDPHSRIISFLAPAFFTGNLMYLYRERLLNTHPAVPWIALYLGIQANYLPEMSWFGGGALAVAESLSIVWVGMAGARMQPRSMPDISYGLYIYHMPFLMLLASYSDIKSMPLMVAAMCASVIPFSLVSWYLVEKPALRFKRSPASDAPRQSPAMSPSP